MRRRYGEIQFFVPVSGVRDSTDHDSPSVGDRSILADEKTRNLMLMNATKRSWAAVCVWVPAVLFVLLLAPVISTAAQKSKTIENIAPRPHLAPAETSPEQLVAGITAATEDQRWQIIGEAPGVVTTRLVRRAHEAVVTIGYDETNFWIDYKDSKNLSYNPKDLMKPPTPLHMGKGGRQIRTKGPRIHPNYNQWVAALANQIEIAMQNPPNRSRTSPLPIADELDKLDKLRRRGVLTQEEFDQQKTKLLAR